MIEQPDALTSAQERGRFGRWLGDLIQRRIHGVGGSVSWLEACLGPRPAVKWRLLTFLIQNRNDDGQKTARRAAGGLGHLPPRSSPMSGTISLGARCAQTAKSKLVDRLLPGTEFIDGQRVAAACLLERKQTTANRGYNLGFATRHPTLRSRWWQIGDRQR